MKVSLVLPICLLILVSLAASVPSVPSVPQNLRLDWNYFIGIKVCYLQPGDSVTFFWNDQNHTLLSVSDFTYLIPDGVTNIGPLETGEETIIFSGDKPSYFITDSLYGNTMMKFRANVGGTYTRFCIGPSSSSSISHTRSTSPSLSPTPSQSTCPNGSGYLYTGETCTSILDCCSGYCSPDNGNQNSGTCTSDASCNTDSTTSTFCNTDTDCCVGFECTGPSSCLPINNGCFHGSTPVRMSDDSIKKVEDIVVGDLVKTPDGTAEVLSVSKEKFVRGSRLFTFNDIDEYWLSHEHIVPDFNNPNLWYIPFVSESLSLFTWRTDLLSELSDRSTVTKLDGSMLEVTNVKKIYVDEDTFVYNFVAWPQTSRSRVPKLYMVGHDIVTLSYVQATLEVCATYTAHMSMLAGAFPLIVAPPVATNTFFSWKLWGSKLGDLHTSWMQQKLVENWGALYPGTPIPTLPPLGYDGPPSAWIDMVEQSYRSAIGKRDYELNGITVDHPSWDYAEHKRVVDFNNLVGKAFIGYWSQLLANIPSSEWLNWVSFEQGRAVQLAATAQVLQMITAYPQTDLITLAQSCFVTIARK